MDTNVIYCGDNTEVLPKYIPTGSVDLIYIDPPFNTSRQYEVFWGEAQERRSFDDRFGDAMTYLDWIKRANQKDALDIVPVTVKEILEHERVAA